MPIRTLGTRISRCPLCGDELIDIQTSEDEERKKECAACLLVFKKKRGPWFRWKMGTEEEFIEDEIRHM